MKDLSWSIFTSKKPDILNTVTKPRSRYRWAILTLSCITCIGQAYIYDLPTSLKTPIYQHMSRNYSLGAYEAVYSLSYALYALPNIFLPFYISNYISKYGNFLLIFMLTFLITSAQILFTISIRNKIWWLYCLSRLVFGFGGEYLIIVNSSVISEWFEGWELTLANLILLTVLRSGYISNYIASIAILKSFDIVLASWIGVIICGISFLASYIMFLAEEKFDKFVSNSESYYHFLENEFDQPSTSNRSNYKRQTSIAYNPMLRFGSMVLISCKELNMPERLRRILHVYEHRNPKIEAHENGKDSTVCCVGGTLLLSSKNSPKISSDIIYRLFSSQRHLFLFFVMITMTVYGSLYGLMNTSSSFLLEQKYFQPQATNCQLIYPGQCQSTINTYNSECSMSSYYQPPLPSNVTIDGYHYIHQIPSNQVTCLEDVWKNGCTYEYCHSMLQAESKASIMM